ncbi:hypothetical protein V1L52_04520 [Treponema sp. HNW]|uniref:hypothetical protein n=1 Tax=Treponema sp. HNW TaxID=3116654 RepID=UPI003D0CEB52
MTDNVESGDIKIHYCLINFILASRSFYCLWFDDGKRDRFLTDTTNTLLYFENENEIRNFCTAHNLNIQKNKAVCYNIDSFMHEFNLYDIDCNIFLDYWNIASDMAYTYSEHFIGDDDGPSGETVGVYDKLFYGNNLPALKKESSEVYIPIWERDELDIIQAVFTDIKRIFHTCLGNLT